MYNRVEARKSVLHDDSSYSGIPTSEEVKEELEKVKRLIEDIA
jgi:hypothetical protein